MIKKNEVLAKSFEGLHIFCKPNLKVFITYGKNFKIIFSVYGLKNTC